MIINCRTIEGFLENMEDYEVFNNRVFVDETRNPLQIAANEQVSFEVNFQVCCVVELGDGGQSFLNFGENCGVDRLLEDDFTGTNRKNELLQKLTDYCGEKQIKIRSGQLSG